LVTKVLVLGHLDRFVPILYHDRRRAILRAVWGIEVPGFGASRESFGELIVRSNDLLRELSVPPFENLEHAANFLFDKAEPADEGSPVRSREGTRQPDPLTFVCKSCGLTRRTSQLADSVQQICRDCA
jgi:hypothetical protein